MKYGSFSSLPFVHMAVRMDDNASTQFIDIAALGLPIVYFGAVRMVQLMT